MNEQLFLNVLDKLHFKHKLDKWNSFLHNDLIINRLATQGLLLYTFIAKPEI